LSCIGEDDGIRFEAHSIGDYVAQHQPGDWNYEIDNGNQITLRYWLSGWDNIHEELSNPPSIMNAEDNTKLQDALATGVRQLKARVADAM